MLKLLSPIKDIPNIRTNHIKAFKKLKITTVSDLLLYFPRRHLDFSKFSNISDVRVGEIVTIQGTIKSIAKRYSFKTHKNLTEAVVNDNTGSIKVTWFNQGYIADMYSPGTKIALSGKAAFYKTLQLANPVHEKITTENLHTGRLVPIYSLPESLYDRTFRNFIHACIPLAGELKDLLPQSVKNTYQLPNLGETVKQMHFPDSWTQLTKAKERLIFEEVLIQQLAVGLHKQQLAKTPAPSIPLDTELIKKVITKLPFQPTIGQKSALWEIMKDMNQSTPMNRLLEGDVGSGKTLVAVLSMFNTCFHSHTTILLAPTEILAKQHYDTVVTFSKLLKNKTLNTLLVTRNFNIINNQSVTKKELEKFLASKTKNLIVGTHALLSKKELFKKLAYIVIDEQHRFGVEQRSALQKTLHGESAPHLLSMTATPIPRTLALTLYGDLEISRLTELPVGRQPISTFVVAEDKRHKAYDFIKTEIKSGRQAFIITPLVEESSTLQTKAVKTEFEKLQKQIFPEFKLGLMHGKLKGQEKETSMNDFYNKKTNILVATSVVEIGVDVPNATIMMIEGAERFGLAQLHQLRGRVGRGEHKSWCFLFTSNGENSLERLHNFSTTTDGFKLAEMDLEERGFGSLFGKEQSGFNFKFSEYLTIKTLKSAKAAADTLLKENNFKKAYPQLYTLAKPLIDHIHLE